MRIVKEKLQELNKCYTNYVANPLNVMDKVVTVWPQPEGKLNAGYAEFHWSGFISAMEDPTLLHSCGFGYTVQMGMGALFLTPALFEEWENKELDTSHFKAVSVSTWLGESLFREYHIRGNVSVLITKDQLEVTDEYVRISVKIIQEMDPAEWESWFEVKLTEARALLEYKKNLETSKEKLRMADALSMLNPGSSSIN